jgi:iron complex outermembrane receptor protein
MLTTRKSKTVLLAATGLAAAMMCAPALAQEATTTATPQPTAAELAATAKAEAGSDEVIIVKGLRKSLKSAVDRKRNSKQIVDSIDAEDAGKLPDNNVIEALAHVTGVQITRARGEGDGLMIRGQGDIQTTLNGAPNASGAGRTASLNDIPAELLKSVQVYKTRSADQVEGGVGGTVNVDLRRPLDLKKGWTFAGSVRNVYGNIGDTESPYGSALIAKRFDTGIGEMGFLVNLSYQENNYNEQYVTSETPALFWCCGTQWDSVPNKATDIAMYRAQYGVEYGKVRRPALNASYQWRVNEQLDFVLEASSFNSRENRSYSALNTRMKDSPGVLSNIVYGPDGHTIISMTETDPDPTDTNILPVGPTSRDDFNKSTNNRVNFEAHWHNDRATVNFAVYRDENTFDNQWVTQTLRLNGLTGFNVDFNSDKIEGGGPYVEYIGADPSNPADYGVKEWEDGKAFENSDETVWSADLTYRLSDDKFFRSFQMGVRHSDRNVDRAYGYRYAGFNTPLAIADFPGGTGLEEVQSDTGSAATPSWYRISRESLLANYDAIRNYLYTERDYAGGSGDWNNEVVDTELMQGSFTSNEKTAAIYGIINYGFKAWNIPVDGQIGVRTVHTWGQSIATNQAVGKAPDYTITPTQVIAPADGTDTMPNATAIVHFTPKVQLRLGYSVNIQRPNFIDASSFVFYDTNGCNCGWGGNPDLKPYKETNYDASLEYYFGRGGVLSAAVYDKKSDGFIVYGANNQDFDGVTYRISRPVNTDNGEYQGVELNAQGFFDFLPSPWNNFGGQANFTYNSKANIYYSQYNGVDITQEQIDTIPGIFDAPNNSKTTYNLMLYYENSKVSARISYNHRDLWRAGLDGYSALGYSTYFAATSRLDAAFDYTPVKWMTIALEGTNLLNDNANTYYGANHLIPQGVRVAARTIQLSARFRY